MAELLDRIQEQIRPDTVRALSHRLGEDEQTTEKAVSMLLPVLVGGLARNADEGASRRSLDAALARDHDGSVLDAFGNLFGGDTATSGPGGLLGSLGSLLGGGANSGRATDADGILQHIFGSRRSEVERGVGNATGMSSGSVGQLLAMLAPMVMGALGRTKRERNLDADGVADVLERERTDIEQSAPGMSQGGLKDLLDSNRDGKISMADDIAKVGAALGAAWLFTRGRRRS